MLIVLTTVSNQYAGETLAAKIVEARLAACVQILPKMTSVYMWQGRVTTDSEHLLLIKTLPENFDELEAFVTANHSYEVPEIVAINATKVSESYFAWLSETLATEPKI